MSFENIDYEVEQGVATLALNRPQSLNSLNDEMHAEIRTALADARERKEVRCVLLTGRGRGFCAGQDLSDRNFTNDDSPPDLSVAIENNYNPLVRTLRALDVPVLCAVNGVAAGAGANIALACDIVLAARSARFIQAFCKIGLLPDSGGTWILPRLVGQARAMGLAMLGDAVSAEQAEQWGMIWKCVDDDKLASESLALAAHLATQPTTGLKLIRRALHSSSAHTLEEQLDLERDYQQIAGRTHDYREGIAAFMNKRTPNFSGE